MTEGEVIYHIAEREAWTKARASGEYRCESLASEGFLHCSRREQVLASANKHFSGRRGLVLLAIAPHRLSSELKIEASRGGALFPHIYGPLNASAVTDSWPFEPDSAGSFQLPPALQKG